MIKYVIGASAVLLVLAPPNALVQAAPQPHDTASYGHAGQPGLRIGLAQPYDVHIRYDDSPPCGSGADDTSVCGFVGALQLDLALSYALTNHIEPYFWVRLGLEGTSRTYTSPTTLVGAGIRVYTKDDRFKLFFDLGAGASFAGASAPGLEAVYNYDTEFPLHLHLGAQYEFEKYLGAYIQAGPNVGFVRAIDAGFEAAIGLQARLP